MTTEPTSVYMPPTQFRPIEELLHPQAAPEQPAAPEPQPEPAAAPEPAPAKTPTPTEPTAQETAALADERRRATQDAIDATGRQIAAAKAAAVLRKRGERLLHASRWIMMAVVSISVIITAFGTGNAHAVFVRHDTADPWGWFPYPALEAALIVEIQAGGLLAEHKLSVGPWGSALRCVTAAMAVTVCVYGPAETGDIGGALLHAIGPVCQFFLAEFLARARQAFRDAIDKLQVQADRSEQAGREPASTERPSRSRARSAKNARTGTGRSRDGESGTTSGDRSPRSGTSPQLVLTPIERRALEKLISQGKNLSKNNIINAVRADNGPIGTTRALEIAAAYRTGTGGPGLHIVAKKEA